jgi:hypothetical protein
MTLSTPASRTRLSVTGSFQGTRTMQRVPVFSARAKHVEEIVQAALAMFQVDEQEIEAGIAHDFDDRGVA